MKALKITFDHGRIWTVETSAGVRASGASLMTVLDKVMPVSSFPGANERVIAVEQVEAGLATVFDGIRDSGHSSGQIARGQASG